MRHLLRLAWQYSHYHPAGDDPDERLALQPEIKMNREAAQIHWLCPECGDEGIVTGWTGLIWDMSDCSGRYPH